MQKSEPARWAIFPGLLGALAPPIAVALAVAVPVEQVPGKTKCIGMLVVSALSLGLGILGLAGSIRSS